MKNIAMLLAAVMMAAAAAMMLGGQPASAAAVNGMVQRSEAGANSNAVQVRQWHQTGPSRIHKRWRSHHRYGSRHRGW